MRAKTWGEAVAIAALVPLNLIFLWTSGVGTWLPFLNPLLDTITGLFVAGTVATLTQFDAIPLSLWMMIITGCLLWFRGEGRLVEVLRTLQAAFLALVPLPAEIYVFDASTVGHAFSGRQFNIVVTSAQATYGIVPWFTNADLLYTSVAIVCFSTLVLRWRGRALPPPARRAP